MVRTISLLALALIASASAPAIAGYPVSEKVTCPVGGKSFTYETTASYSIWGHRPDGKPYGSWGFPMALPKCPDNGLVMFDEFTKEEVKRLEPLVASADYQAIQGAETTYFLASWLAQELGRDPQQAAWLLVQASWQADDRPNLKARYQALYVDRIRNLPKSADELEWLALQGRAVNGLRELKRFEEAEALLATLDLTPLDVPIPEEKFGAAAPSGLGKELLNDDEIEAAKNKRGFLGFFKALGELVRAKEPASEPLRMIPADLATHMCKEKGAEMSQADKDYCESPEMKKLQESDD